MTGLGIPANNNILKCKGLSALQPPRDRSSCQSYVARGRTVLKLHKELVKLQVEFCSESGKKFFFHMA